MRVRCGWFGLVLACLWSVAAFAQQGSAAVALPPASVGAALRSLGARAGTIFVGQVASIVRQPGAVEITFRVDSTVQGATARSYMLREWAGLWPPGQHRYWIGERAMVFLRPGSGAGLSTPVDGADGVVPVLVQGAAAEPLLDVRNLAARVQRGVSDPLPTEETAAVGLAEASALATGWRRPVWREPVQRPLPIIFRSRMPGAGMPVRIVPARTPVQALLTPSAGGVDAR